MGFQDRIDALTRLTPWVPVANHERQHYQNIVNPYASNLVETPYAGAVMGGPFSDVAQRALNFRQEAFNQPLENQNFLNNIAATQMNFKGADLPPIQYAASSLYNPNNPVLSNHAERRSFGMAMNEGVERALNGQPQHPALQALRAAHAAYPKNAETIGRMIPGNPDFNQYRDAINRPSMATTVFSERSPCGAFNPGNNDTSCLNYFTKMLPGSNNTFGYAEHFKPGDGGQSQQLKRQALAARSVLQTHPNNYRDILGDNINPAILAAYPYLRNMGD